MLNKRIASILVAGMVMVSMVGCQSTKGHVEYNDMRENPIESQYEEKEQSTDEQTIDNSNLTVKEKREVEKAKEAGKQVKKSSKASDENTRKPRYWLGQYIGDYTDSEVAEMNKIIYDEIDKAIEKEFQNDNTDENNLDDTPVIDYGAYDDCPDEYDVQESQEQNTGEVQWNDETTGETKYVGPEEVNNIEKSVEEHNQQVEQQQNAQSNVESNIEVSEPSVEE